MYIRGSILSTSSDLCKEADGHPYPLRHFLVHILIQEKLSRKDANLGKEERIGHNDFS